MRAATRNTTSTLEVSATRGASSTVATVLQDSAIEASPYRVANVATASRELGSTMRRASIAYRARTCRFDGSYVSASVNSSNTSRRGRKNGGEPSQDVPGSVPAVGGTERTPISEPSPGASPRG
ncbi:hypothetical protein [Blastococcus brunescens]|uniref:Uncharacterized protein n=1 Tax=Blastococcus brunescens TaxID=1564165 RepID=A0ABZ1B2R8_9ACTN|nr:hypothetical protein [Blastococcus sp. BMG 8361]WRL65111.1 hypothetical protein U6N30_05330 [Blastococcus sp. BMG 8361]